MSARPVSTPSFRQFKSSSATASRVMARNTARNTRCETLLFSALRRAGLRFRKHVRDLPGKPDVVCMEDRAVVFCDGDFWHGRQWRARRKKLAQGANSDYWIAKIESNIRR